MREDKVKLLSGVYDPITEELDLGKKPYGVRTYENVLEDVKNPEYKISTINMEQVSIGERALDLLLKTYELGVELKLSKKLEDNLVQMRNSGTQQIDEMGMNYVEWLIQQSERLNNPFMVLEDEDKKLRLVQYLDSRGDTIRLKALRSYVTQPYICEEELRKGRDIYSIITIVKSDIVSKRIIWRFVGTGYEQAVAETLYAVITGQLSFRP